MEADGQTLTAEDAAHIWEEVKNRRQQDGEERALDELDAIGDAVSDD